MTAFAHLFSPIQIGTMTAKNRILMSAMSINFGVDDKGRVTDQLTEYFVRRARGGAGMMLVGGGAVDPSGLELPDLPTLWDDGCIEPLARMVAQVKPFGCRFGVQLMHGGRQSYHDQKVAPSPIPAAAVVKGIPRELTAKEIAHLVTTFGDAARRCRQAGFDFIEVHAAHGYLINQFLSPNANRRTDAYGGSFENRTRFLSELLEDIKTKCGADFPVGLRINGNDYIEGGWTLDEAIRLAGQLEDQGADYLHVSAGVYGSTQLTIPSMYVPQGCFVHLAEAVKPHVTIPVFTVGRIKSPAMADRIIADGKADAVALGRSLIADPAWPKKAEKGEPNTIRPCIGCCLGCIHAVLALEPGGCVVNPDVGREYLLKDHVPSGKTRSVLVVGGGPAGLAAARKAALDGHRVALCEKDGRTGGALHLAARAPGRAELDDILSFLERELARLKVPVFLNSPLSAELLDAMTVDTVLLATGSLADMPMIKGLFQSKMDVWTVHEVLDGTGVCGQKVIVLGGQQAGLMVADWLALAGKQVAVLNRKAHFGEDMSSNDRFYLRERLKSDRVTLHKPVAIDEFSPDGVRFRVNGSAHCLEGYDSVVIAEAMAPVRDAAKLVKGRDLEVQFVGDAKDPRHLMFAISEAEEAVRAF